MKPGICPIHGVTNLVLSSPRLAESITNDKGVRDFKIIRLHIDSYDRDSTILVDDTFALAMNLSVSRDDVYLRDRSVVSKDLRDRLLIQKLIKQMVWTCQICLTKLYEDNNFSL